MDHIIKYFEGEKLQCIIGAIVSIICISVAIYFLFLQKPVLKGVAYTVIPLSLFLLAICIGIIMRTPKDIVRVTTFYTDETEKMKTEELPRMEAVMKSFGIIKKVEIGLILAGIILATFFWGNDLLRGVALGLIILGAGFYLFDHLAEGRGEPYIEFLKTL